MTNLQYNTRYSKPELIQKILELIEQGYYQEYSKTDIRKMKKLDLDMLLKNINKISSKNKSGTRSKLKSGSRSRSRSKSKSIKDKETCIRASNIHLKSHQKKVVNFINGKKRGLIVIHSVGSGKTLTAVTVGQCFLKKNKKGRVIVITPTSLQMNFIKEMQGYGVPLEYESRYEFYTMDGFLKATRAGSMKCKDNLIIVDEAHNLRTHIQSEDSDLEIASKEAEGPLDTDKTGKKVLAILQCTSIAKKVLLLTATPSINKPKDFLNLLMMVDGMSSIKRSQKLIKDDDLIEYLKCKVSIFSPDLAERAKYYPKHKIEEIYLKMDKNYYKKYREIEQGLINDLNLQSQYRGDLHTFYNGVRRASNNLELENSPKVNWVIDQIKSHPKSKFLIFSHFLKAGNNLLHQRLKELNIAHGFINGSISKNERYNIVEDYNDGNLNIILISKAGGEGLDLKETDYVIIMEPSWNESTIEQVIGRAIRYKSHVSSSALVHIYKLFMIKPTEEKNINKILDTLSADKKLSIDVYLRNYSISKQERIDKFLKKIETVSIENMNCETKKLKNFSKYK